MTAPDPVPAAVPDTPPEPGKVPGDFKHGTTTSYTKRRCRCRKCISFWRRYNQGRRAARSLANGRRREDYLAKFTSAHGSPRAYEAGCRCKECESGVSRRKEMRRAAKARHRAKRGGLPLDQYKQLAASRVQHGTYTMYAARGCRCVECTVAAANHKKERKARESGDPFVPIALPKIERFVAAVKRGDKIGEYDFKGLSREDLVLVNEAFADIDIDTGNAR